MKSTNVLLFGAALSGAIASGIVQAGSQIPPMPMTPPSSDLTRNIVSTDSLYPNKKPAYNRAQRLAICMIETALSTVAAATVGGSGCNPIDLTVAVDVGPGNTNKKGSLNGTLSLEGGNNLTKNKTSLVIAGELVDAAAGYGSKCKVSDGDNHKENTIFEQPLKRIDGQMGWSRGSAVLAGEVPTIEIGKEHYDEHIIKDFILVDPCETKGDAPAIAACQDSAYHNLSFDWGLEVITKHRVDEDFDKIGYPFAKWLQISAHHPANGIDGEIWVRKHRLFPDSSCHMDFYVHGPDYANQYHQTGVLSISNGAAP